MCSLVLPLTTSLQLVASQQVPSIFACLPVFTSLLRITFAVIQKTCQENFRKFQESDESKFGGSEKDYYFLKFQNGTINLIS